MSINIFYFSVEQNKIEDLYVYAKNSRDAQIIAKEKASDIDWSMVGGSRDDYEICDLGLLSVKSVGFLSLTYDEIITYDGSVAEDKIIEECDALLGQAECDGQRFLDLGKDMDQHGGLLVGSEEYQRILGMKKAMIKRKGK